MPLSPRNWGWHSGWWVGRLCAGSKHFPEAWYIKKPHGQLSPEPPLQLCGGVQFARQISKLILKISPFMWVIFSPKPVLSSELSGCWLLPR